MKARFILDGHDPVPCKNLTEWAKWYENSDRQVAKEIIDKIEVDTIFLGIDRRLAGDTPILFETQIFGGEYNGLTTRCATWEQAEERHAEAVSLVKKHQK